MSSFREREFNQACIEDRHDVIDTMLANGYIPTSYNFEIACRQGDQLLVTKLLSYSLNFQGGFMQAVEKGHLHLLDHLYTRIDINKPDGHGNTILHWYVNDHVTQWLLDMGARQIPDNDGNTPLHFACMYNRIDRVKLMLQYTSDHTPNNNGETPIDIANRNGYTSLVQLLEANLYVKK